jgi:hypothetical protein
MLFGAGIALGLALTTYGLVTALTEPDVVSVLAVVWAS